MNDYVFGLYLSPKKEQHCVSGLQTHIFDFFCNFLFLPMKFYLFHFVIVYFQT